MTPLGAMGDAAARDAGLSTTNNEERQESFGSGNLDDHFGTGKRRLDESRDANDDAAVPYDDAADILDSAHNNKNNGAAAGGADEHAVVQCTTTAGPIKMHLHRSWSPNGYDRASTLFERGYYDQSHFFRVVPHFLVQFGISYTNDGELKHFADSNIKDDPKKDNLMPFREGYMSFAGSGPNSRTSQLFIAYDRAGGLGTSPWETPFGEVVEGLENVRNLYSGYGDMPPWGKGPQQGPIRNQGSKYIEENFPMLDKFEKCTVRRMDSLLENEEDGEQSDEENLATEEMKEEVADSVGDTFQDETRRELRGSDMKVKPIDLGHLAAKGIPMAKVGGEVTESKVPLSAKIALIVIFLILGLLFVRRKKTKKMGKSV